jgi:hypothetical protein
MLEYGCEYGFIAYWFMIKNRGNRITGYDSDTNAIAIAEHCYMKTEWIDFTSKKEDALQKKYDIVILNKVTEADMEEIPRILSSAHTVVIRKKDFIQLWEICTSNGFANMTESDASFVIFERKNKIQNNK